MTETLAKHALREHFKLIPIGKATAPLTSFLALHHTLHCYWEPLSLLRSLMKQAPIIDRVCLEGSVRS